MAILNNSNAISSGGYDINNSLRFRQSASAFLNRTPGSASNRKTWTWSGWVKRGSLATGTGQILFSTGPTGAGQTWNQYFFETDNTLRVINFVAGTPTFGRQSTPVYRDPSAWYHIVILFDTTQATDTNRLKFYVNGTEIATTTIAGGYAAYPTLNLDGTVNNTVTHGVGGIASNSYLDGYLAEVNFIDGQALTPSSFGNTNSATGVWQPAKYTGTYGTNGFYLNFSDTSALTSGSNTGIGKDFSGNGNYWSSSNISITAGVTYDAMTDSPTLTSATVANYPTWNPLKLYTSSALTLSNANLTASDTTSNISTRIATMSLPTTGKWYWEITVTAISAANGFVGAIDAATANGNSAIQSKGTYRSNGEITNLAGTLQTGGASYTNADIIGVAVDVTAGTVQFYKNNVAQGSTPSFSFSAGTELFPYVATDNNAGTKTFDANFGQRPFAYTPPTGFLSLNTFNLPDSTIKKGNTVMDATTYSGNSTVGTNITNSGSMRPDMVWIKKRSAVQDHFLVDSVRGVGASSTLSPNLTTIEQYQFVTALNSNGFQVNADTAVNGTGSTYVGWQWQAGQGTNTTNTAGSVTSTVSVNATAGFSIVTYTIPASGSGWTIGHGLGVAPQLIIAKSRSNAVEWKVYHRSIGNTGYVVLNSTGGTVTDSGAWNNTSPTSTVFTNGTTGFWGASFTYVAYCWAEIAGFSKFGSYTGNGSADGPFVFTNFRPKFLMVKRTDSTGMWSLWDTSRNTFNSTNLLLQANTSDAETSGIFTNPFDLLSNGFKLRDTSLQINASGGTFIYMAFAENPFKNANAR